MIPPGPDGEAKRDLGSVARQNPDPPRDPTPRPTTDLDQLGVVSSQVIYQYVLSFSDDQRFVAWTQRGEIEERVSPHRTQPGSRPGWSSSLYDPARPAYRYVASRVLPAEVAREAGSPAEVGWLRCTWRQIF